MEVIEMESAASNDQKRSRSNLTPLECWRCKRDSSKGEIIRPCNCINLREFIHIHCLEKYTTRQQMRHCMICQAPFPIKQKYKPLLEWFRNREMCFAMLRDIYSPLLQLICLLLIDILLIVVIISLVFMYKTLKLPFNDQLSLFIGIIILLLVLIVFIFIQISGIKGFARRIYEACSKWYASNQEMKVVRSRVHVIFETL